MANGDPTTTPTVTPPAAPAAQPPAPIQLDPDNPAQQTIQIDPDTAAQYDPAQDKRAAFLKTKAKVEGPAIEPAPDTSVLHKLAKTVVESLPNYSSKTVTSPDYGKAYLATEELTSPEWKRAHPETAGVVKAAGEMVTPGTVLGAAALPGLYEAAAGSYIPALVSAFFGGQMAEGVYSQYPGLKKATDSYASAKTPEERADAMSEATRQFTHMGADTAFGLLATAHGVKGAVDILNKFGSAGIPDDASTFKSPGGPGRRNLAALPAADKAAGAAAEESVSAPGGIRMSRAKITALKNLGYSEKAIEHLSGIEEIQHIIKNQIKAPPTIKPSPNAVEVMPSPKIHPPAEDVAATAAGEPPADLQMGEAVAPKIKTEGPEWDRTHSAYDDEGKKIGSVGYKLDPEGEAQMYGQYVEPEHRGKGIAQNLVRSAIDEAREAGASRFVSDSTGISPEASRVWERLRDKGLPVENITHPNGKPGYQIDFEQPVEVPTRLEAHKGLIDPTRSLQDQYAEGKISLEEVYQQQYPYGVNISAFRGTPEERAGAIELAHQKALSNLQVTPIIEDRKSVV